MSGKAEAIAPSVAAILVLFTAMLDPRVSVALAVAALLGLAAYELVRTRAAR